MRHALRCLLLASGLLCTALPAGATDRTGTHIASQLLREHVGGRPAAMSGAYTAVARGPLALRYNPAGLADETNHTFLFQHSASVLEIKRNEVGWTLPLASGGAGIALSYLDYGTMMRTTTVDKTGVGTFGAHDLLLRGGYGWRLSERLAVGGTLGLFQLAIDDADAVGLTADVGATYRCPGLAGLLLGASLRNLGPGARFDREREEFPLALVLGAACRPVDAILLTADGEYLRNEDCQVRFGAEFTLRRGCEHVNAW
ncbi:MAG TPA: hypothetical protein PKM88_16230, partial [bacterium]|nr:hypothetical protein [bacterium]